MVTQSAPSDDLLLDFARRKFAPLCVYVDDDLKIIKVVGDAIRYGYSSAGPDAFVVEIFHFLHGAELDSDFEFEFVETPNGGCAHMQWRQLDHAYLLLVVDATQERDQRQALQQKSNEVQLLLETQSQLLTKQQRLNAVQAQFIGNMSHEFRTPLSSIVTYAQYLNKPDPRIALAVGLESIDRAAKYLLNLVDNLIDQAQFEIDEVELRPSVTSSRALVSDLESMFQATAQSKGLDLRLTLSERVPGDLYLDAVRVRQVLINLLGNAFKFTKAGFVALDIDWDENRLHVVVEDTGSGISESALKTIFQPFERDEGVSVAGAGLGLSISKRLVEMMGGDIELKSNLGEGTRVSFSIWAKLIDNGVRSAQKIDDVQSVLVVEDDSDVYEILEIYLDDAGYSVYHADSGVAALDVIQSVGVDGVVTDLNLPDMSGLDVVRKLRKANFAGPLVVLTASNSTSDRSSALAAGCTEFLVKPVSATVLANALNSLTDQQQNEIST